MAGLVNNQLRFSGHLPRLCDCWGPEPLGSY